MRAELGEKVRAYGLRAPVEALSFGRPVPGYGLTRAFFDGKAGARRDLALHETGMWMLPVSQKGKLRAVVFAGEKGQPWRYTGITGSADLAEILTKLRPGDLIFSDGPTDATFVLRGSTVSELDTGGKRRVLKGPVPLRRFHDELMAAYAGLTRVGPDETN